jgi:hypothetical protein
MSVISLVLMGFYGDLLQIPLGLLERLSGLVFCLLMDLFYKRAEILDSRTKVLENIFPL